MASAFGYSSLSGMPEMIGQPDWASALDFTGSPGMSSGLTAQIPDLSKMGTGITGVSAVADNGLFGTGVKAGDLQFGLQGLNTIGNLWAAWQSASLAKKQFNYTKSVGDTNLANQIKSYNTQLTDRANNRAIVEGRTPAETQAYIDQNKMTRQG